ncbi:MAG: EcsC family protein [Clostridia bacterium]|nr:EcsC family protein [Clostridia bacterium]
MNKKKDSKINNLNVLTKNAVSISSKAIGDVKDFAKDKALPKIKESMVSTKDAVSNVTNDLVTKAKSSITEEQISEILDSLYIKSINGIPKVSLPIDDLVDDYITKNNSVELAAKSLINNSIVKCGTSGFVTGLGGFTTMIATLPANVTSVMYVQLRMCCAIAKMAGYDINSDQVQTLIYACLTGSAVADILKQAGIRFGNKFGVAMVKKIPGKTLQAINKKVGFRFVTKFGETGIVNLGKIVPVIGGVIGGGIDVASTRVIGNNAYKIFIEGELPTNDNVEKEVIVDADFTEIDDIDCQTLSEALENKI